ncbi:MAG: FAD binding domain-containing protein [Candidatus Hatepunaea meridiana]|nr:FAD binding domain-containing protein [Candidatus Hatepunaea meridiana]
MILPKFDYFAPRSLVDATNWLAEHKNESAKVLAGGTDLLVNLRGKIIPDGHRPRCQQHHVGPWQARHLVVEKPHWLMALSRIPELQDITVKGNQIHIGAMVTHSQLESSDVIREKLTGLSDAASVLGSPLCRNRGTYGGNLCNARPASDTSIPTMALQGKLVLVSKRRQRIVNHTDFVIGPGESIIEPDEILKEIIFTIPDNPMSSAYIKLANRKALEIAVVGAAAVVIFDSDKETILNARIALAAVAPTPLLVPEAGDYLKDRKLTLETASEAARISSQAARPITDHRGRADYRKLMIEVLVRRALMRCRDRISRTVEKAL